MERQIIGMNEINIIDSSMFSIYIGYRLITDKLECDKRVEYNKTYYVCTDSKKVKKIFDEKLFNLLKDKIMKDYIIERKDGDKYVIEIRRDKLEELRKIVSYINNACYPYQLESKVCLITPDVGVYSRGDMVNPIILASKTEPEKPETNEWNSEINRALFDLNAKILLDEDLRTMLGEETYRRLVKFWREIVGDRVYTDTEDRLKPFIKIESITDNIKDEITISKDYLRISNKEVSKDMIDKHVALRKVVEVLTNMALNINEHVEAKKRVLLSELEKGRVREYHGIEGRMDFYLKTLTYNPNVKIYTIDKDIIKEITVRLKPNRDNIVIPYK